jgi:membrane protease YdiL (CAAX protease family)
MFISWGGLFGSYLFLPAPSFFVLSKTITPGMPVAFSLMGILASYGPSIAGLIVTAICFGEPGVDEWFGRWIRYRVSWKWYVVALLCAPVLFVLQHLITYPQAFVHRMFLLPTWREMRDIYFGLFLSLLLYLPYIAGEEGGWRGFALPQLQRRYGAAWASCIIAAMWLAWHFPQTLRTPSPYYESGTLSVGVSLVRVYLVMVLFSMVCTWIFNRSHGSLLPVITWHAMTDAMGNTERYLFPPVGPLRPGHAIGDWVLWPIITVLLLWFTRGRLGYSDNKIEANSPTISTEFVQFKS